MVAMSETQHNRKSKFRTDSIKAHRICIVGMKPLFIYPISQSSTWYIIITDTLNHFYFNADDGHAYWQLSDLVEKYGVDIEELLAQVNYDQLGLLFARSRGLRLRSHKTDKSGENVSTVGGDQEQLHIKNEVEIVYENEPVDKNENETSEKLNPVEETFHVKSAGGKGIVSGYSSSEDEEEEDDQVKADETPSHGVHQKAPTNDKDITDDIVSKVLDQRDDEEEQSDNHSQISLDLSVDDESEEKKSAIEEFKQMLDNYSSQISSFDSWDIIEDQLVNEFIKYPVYHGIGSRREKLDIFLDWVDNRDLEEKAEDLSDEQEEEMVFPTGKIQLLSLLQNHKDQVKALFYQEFYTSHYKSINQIDLPKSTKEETYGSYKQFIQDFAKFERDFKKTAEYKKGVNVKVMKLDEYLSSQESFPKGTFTIFPELSFFDNWIRLLNQFFKNEVTIAEAEINFLLGDEKRLNSYVSKLNAS